MMRQELRERVVDVAGDGSVQNLLDGAAGIDEMSARRLRAHVVAGVDEVEGHVEIVDERHALDGRRGQALEDFSIPAPLVGDGRRDLDSLRGREHGAELAGAARVVARERRERGVGDAVDTDLRADHACLQRLVLGHVFERHVHPSAKRKAFAAGTRDGVPYDVAHLRREPHEAVMGDDDVLGEVPRVRVAGGDHRRGPGPHGDGEAQGERCIAAAKEHPRGAMKASGQARPL